METPQNKSALGTLMSHLLAPPPTIQTIGSEVQVVTGNQSDHVGHEIKDSDQPHRTFARGRKVNSVLSENKHNESSKLPGFCSFELENEDTEKTLKRKRKKYCHTC